ncbi:MAG: protoporphyrinogen oxidase [Opitutaceae bacterium]|nr:protoporphyrinogen oxidase [Opitutaceae bacterium]
MPAATKSIAVLGAGITGLTAAHRLDKQGHRVRVFEQQNRIGGAVGTDIIDGWLCERGPNSMLANDPAIMALIDELGLSEEYVKANSTARKRYLVKWGMPMATPSSPVSLITTPLFSFGAKRRLITELFQRPRQHPDDVSLGQFVEDHFGREIVDYALNPLIGGVYAGDPSQLSAQHAFPTLWEAEKSHGSIIRAMIAKMSKRGKSKKPKTPRVGIISFKHGLQTLTNALAARLPSDALSLNTEVTQITRDGSWHVTWKHDGSEHTETFDMVVSALPASGLANLQVGSSNDHPLEVLQEVLHPPVDSLVLGYRCKQIAHALDGFGMLVPEIEKRSVLGVLFSSSLFAGRAPDGHASLTVMVGGTRQPELTGLDTDELLRRIQPDLSAMLGVEGEPVFRRHQSWPRAIPQYNLGHGRFLDAIAACEEQNQGLFIGGQVRDGIALPACISAGEKLAARATES